MYQVSDSTILEADTLREDDGCGTELDYIEQTSWVLFLKYLDDFESEKETAALLNGETYTRIIDGEFRWNVPSDWSVSRPRPFWVVTQIWQLVLCLPVWLAIELKGALGNWRAAQGLET